MAILPKEGGPAAGKGPEAAEPAIGERRSENGAMRMVVKVDADIDSGNPAKHDGGGDDEGDAGPWPGDADERGMLIEPEGAGVGGKASEMEDYAMPVLGIGKKATPRGWGRDSDWIAAHKDLIATVTARIVIRKLTQGPQSIAPTMSTIAKSGQNDLPKVRASWDRNGCDKRVKDMSGP